MSNRLWRELRTIRHGAADAGDRNPAGSGRSAERRVVAGVFTGTAAGTCRRCNWIRVNGADVAKPGQSALGDFGARPGNTRIGFGNADRYKA